MLALCLNVASGVLKDNNGIVFAVGTLDDPMLLGCDGFPGPDDLCHYLWGWFCYSNIFHVQTLLPEGSKKS